MLYMSPAKRICHVCHSFYCPSIHHTFSSVSKKPSKIVFMRFHSSFIKLHIRFNIGRCSSTVSLLSELDIDFDLDFHSFSFYNYLIIKEFLKICISQTLYKYAFWWEQFKCIHHYYDLDLLFDLDISIPHFHWTSYSIWNLKVQKNAFCLFNRCWDGEVMDMYSVVWPDWV